LRTRLESQEQAIQKHVLSRGVIIDQETEMHTNFDTLFKQLFCVTAQELSNELRQPMTDVGTLYDHVLATTIPFSRLSRVIGRSSLPTGKGQLIFIVRQLENDEACRLTSLGFRFATIEHITSTLSRRIHIPEASLLERLCDMRNYSTSGRRFTPGVHLISFMMRPTVQDHFEVLTTKGTGNPLPSSTLSLKRLSVQHLDLISRMEGWSMNTCTVYLKSKAAIQSDRSLDEFRRDLLRGIVSLSHAFPERIRSAACFSSRPLLAPCHNVSRHSEEGQHQPQCMLLAFCVVATLNTRLPGPELDFTPFQLFRVQQQVNDTIADQEGFCSELMQDPFGTDIRSGSETPDSKTMPFTKSPMLRLWPPRKSSTLPISGHSQESLVDPTAIVLGDITVKKEVRVEFSWPSENAVPNAVQTHEAVVAAANVAATPITYVDELYSLCHAPGVRLRPNSSVRTVRKCDRQ
jgi:hypothetical protein